MNKYCSNQGLDEFGNFIEVMTEKNQLGSFVGSFPFFHA